MIRSRPCRWRCPDSLDALARVQTEHATGELAGSVHVTFVHNEPDLRTHIPAIPG
ncbi:MAG: hypothetical protein KAY59_08290 [Acidobacteria bacterium]|nr:hypothetical protein [Acidobacteriota bacterium]